MKHENTDTWKDVLKSYLPVIVIVVVAVMIVIGYHPCRRFFTGDDKSTPEEIRQFK